MKKIKLFILVTAFITELGNAQSIYFNKRIDVTGNWEVCRGIVLTKGGYLVAGGQGEAIVGIYMSKIDSLGNLKWTQYYENPSYSYYFGLSGALFQTKDKYYAICGGRVLWPTGHSILIKIDSLGNKKWEKEYELTDCSNNFNSGNITKDSGFILTGYAFDGPLGSNYLLLKTDSLGNQQWYKTYTDNDPNRSYEGKCVIQTPDKGYCLGGGGGYWLPPATYFHSIVEIIKTDSLGNQQWKKTYGNPLFCNLEAMLCLSKDSCIVSTYNLGNSDNPDDDRQVYITKIGLDGIEKWNKKVGIVFPSNWVSWIEAIKDEGFILSGSHLVKDTLGKYIGWLFKLDENGDSLWYREYAVIHGLEDVNQLWQVTTTPDNGFAAAGSLFPNSAGGTQDIWVFKTDSMGCIFPGCDVGITEFNPNAGAQMLIYPNPFTNAFAINYNIPKESKKGVFELRDMFGSLVYSTPLSNNVNQLQVVAGSLKAGIYLAIFIVDGVTVCSEKIIKE